MNPRQRPRTKAERHRAELLLALAPVVQEINNRHPAFSDPNYNPDAHLEITLTVKEVRAIFAAVEEASRKGKGTR